MRVLILFEIEAGGLGGGESVLIGLVRGLAALEAEGDHYTILCPPGFAVELKPWLGGHIEVVSRPSSSPTLMQQLKKTLGRWRRPVGRLMRRLMGKKGQGLPTRTPQLDPFIQSLPHDVLHFMMPLQYAGGSPRAVFTIHDLQHEHLPGIFGEVQIAYRRMLYEDIRRDCAAIVAISHFTAQDFQKHHPCESARLYTVPWAAYADEAAQSGLSGEEQRVLSALPTEFMLYPAYSYRHKNHRHLLTALSIAAKEQALPLICTGGRSEEWPLIEAHWKALKPQPAMQHLGRVSRSLLSELFRRARFVVFPTLFEGAGLPLLEAARAGKAIACSDIPPFREFGGAGPAYFNPEDPAEMAAVLLHLWHDPAERERSARESAAVSVGLSWEKCARSYRAIYRKVSGKPLTEADLACLEQAQYRLTEISDSP